MQTLTRFATKSLTLLVAGATVAAAPAGAQVAISGNTLGCFGTGCTPTSSTSSFTIGGTGETISVAGTTFSGETNPVTNGFTVGNFGTLVLTPAPTNTTPNTSFVTPFTLLFQLTTPGGASTASSSFTVTGFVGNSNGQGTRDISYTGFTTPFTFSNGAGTIAVDGGQIGVSPTTISGRVTATASSTVPEPSTYALLAMGFVGLAGAVARRRNSAA